MQIYYYEDELKDEFSKAKIIPKKSIKITIIHRKHILKKFLHRFCYTVVAKPVAWCFLKIKYHHKIIGKEKLKSCTIAVFLCMGTTHNAAADALIPTMVSHPADTYVIVHPNNVSMPIFGKVTPYLGALPLPDDADAAKNFIKEITEKITEKKMCHDLSGGTYLAILYKKSDHLLRAHSAIRYKTNAR